MKIRYTYRFYTNKGVFNISVIRSDYNLDKAVTDAIDRFHTKVKNTKVNGMKYISSKELS